VPSSGHGENKAVASLRSAWQRDSIASCTWKGLHARRRVAIDLKIREKSGSGSPAAKRRARLVRARVRVCVCLCERIMRPGAKNKGVGLAGGRIEFRRKGPTGSKGLGALVPRAENPICRPFIEMALAAVYDLFSFGWLVHPRPHKGFTDPCQFPRAFHASAEGPDKVKTRAVRMQKGASACARFLPNADFLYPFVVLPACERATDVLSCFYKRRQKLSTRCTNVFPRHFSFFSALPEPFREFNLFPVIFFKGSSLSPFASLCLRLDAPEVFIMFFLNFHHSGEGLRRASVTRGTPERLDAISVIPQLAFRVVKIRTMF
jgi:hypothetical protein